jgi:CDP-paratose 2-epimerase
MAGIYFISGGAGFIGSNYVHRLLARGEKVIVYDNFSRPGSRKNLAWLTGMHGPSSFQVIEGDVRDAALLKAASQDAEILVHLAAQVAVTTSVVNPREDFEINAQGTFNLLEAARENGQNPIILYASTNKVYGGMEDVEVIEKETRWQYTNLPHGCPETQPLDFHSPYGCSKGAGDQYVRDYARIYNLPTIVLRQSCIYGPRQFGVEDQGWLAWMVIAAVTGRKFTIYGDGKQIRDVLNIEDLMDAYDAAIERIHIARGHVYNIGGGPQNTMSVWTEFKPLLERILGRPVEVGWGDWRPGDQRVFVADIRKASKDLGWRPRINVEQGVTSLYRWVLENKELFQ